MVLSLWWRDAHYRPRGALPPECRVTPWTGVRRPLDPARADLRNPDRGGSELVHRPLPDHLVAVGLLQGRPSGAGREGLHARGRERPALLHLRDPARARARAGGD